MKKISVLCLVVVMLFALCSCQFATKHLGGSMTVNLEPNTKLVNVTWKEDSLWFLTKPMTEDDIPETYEFKESSEFGVLEGTVTIIEHKDIVEANTEIN